MKVNTNIPALKTLNSLTKANNNLSKTMEKLSSGYRINCAADDAAGLAISEKLNTQVIGLQRAKDNAMDGISMIQTAEGALNEVHSMLQRIRELTVKAANGAYTSSDQQKIQDEIDALLDEIQATQKNTEFNTIPVLASSDTNYILHIGANKDQTMTLDASRMNLANAIDILIDRITGNSNVQAIASTTNANVEESINVVDRAIEAVSNMRSYLGACQNRLEYTVSNLSTSEQNMTEALSRIKDADMAEEMTEYTQQTVISQAATAMLSQANQLPQQVLQLLG